MIVAQLFCGCLLWPSIDGWRSQRRAFAITGLAQILRVLWQRWQLGADDLTRYPPGHQFMMPALSLGCSTLFGAAVMTEAARQWISSVFQNCMGVYALSEVSGFRFSSQREIGESPPSISRRSTPGFGNAESVSSSGHAEESLQSSCSHSEGSLQSSCRHADSEQSTLSFRQSVHYVDFETLQRDDFVRSRTSSGVSDFGASDD